MKRAIVFLLLLLAGLVAGCGNQTAVRTVTVKVPVAQPCVPASLPDAPAYPDTDGRLRAAPDAADRYRLLILGREIRIARLGLLEGVAAACREDASIGR